MSSDFQVGTQVKLYLILLNTQAYVVKYLIKARLQKEGIFFLVHLFARDILLMKKLEIEKTKPTFIISVLKVEYQVVLVSSIFSFFINKMSLANKWMRKKYLLSVIQLYQGIFDPYVLLTKT